MQLNFSKYEGAGNDFILIDNRDGATTLSAAQIARLCHRHFGIGADGLMLLGAAEGAFDCTMRYFNADGSEGEMCGNGARCFALFMHHLGIGGAEKYFRAVDGPHRARLLADEGEGAQIEIRMIDVERIDAGKDWWSLNTGVPHYVEFVDDVTKVDVIARGHAIRHDTARFPQGTNVNFVEHLGAGQLRMRTYERGVENETLACGTGATAAAMVAHHVCDRDTRRFDIAVPGGRLQVRFACEPDTTRYTEVYLTGPARRVFQGHIAVEAAL